MPKDPNRSPNLSMPLASSSVTIFTSWLLPTSILTAEWLQSPNLSKSPAFLCHLNYHPSLSGRLGCVWGGEVGGVGRNYFQSAPTVLWHGSLFGLLPFPSFLWMYIVYTNPYADEYGADNSSGFTHCPPPISRPRNSIVHMAKSPVFLLVTATVKVTTSTDWVLAVAGN